MTGTCLKGIGLYEPKNLIMSNLSCIKFPIIDSDVSRWLCLTNLPTLVYVPRFTKISLTTLFNDFLMTVVNVQALPYIFCKRGQRERMIFIFCIYDVIVPLE